MKKSPITITLILFAIFLAYTCACIVVDVSMFTPRPVFGGEESYGATDIGFYTLNIKVHHALGYHDTFYKISEYLGYAALLTGAAIGVLWLISLIQKKNILKVNSSLNAAILTMALMAVFYVLFEVIKLNFRPVILAKDGLEASYPSSHTLLGCVVFGCAAFICTDDTGLINDKATAKSLGILFYTFAALLTLFRALSGVHWISDIIGGLLLSSALLAFNRFARHFQDEIPRGKHE